MSLKLHAPVGNPRANKILIAAKIANQPVEFVHVAYDKLEKPEFLEKNPLGKVPVLETPEGYLTESNAILRYVVKGTPLLGATDFQIAKVNQWLDFASFELEPHFLTLALPVYGFYPIDPAQGQAAHNELGFKLKVLNEVFKGSNYLVGEGLTIADINLASYVQGIFTLLYGDADRKQFPHLVRWYENVCNLPAYLEFCGRTRFCKNPFPALQIVHAPQKQQQEQPQKKEKQAKQPAQTKQQQPSQKPKKEEEEDDEPAPKKETDLAKQELDTLPPSTFDIDNWKRQFLASKDLKGEMQEFWNQYDSQGWSIWEVCYQKAENEGKVLLSFINNCNGFLQRTNPHFKKYAFAIHGIYGQEPNLEIRGAWIWRGTQIPLYLKDHPTFEWLTIKKLDETNQADRALFEEYWVNQIEDESKVKGETARQLQYFR